MRQADEGGRATIDRPVMDAVDPMVFALRDRALNQRGAQDEPPSRIVHPARGH